MFYRKTDDILEMTNSVISPDYELIDVDYANYIYPVHGWYWFDTEEEAKEFFGIQNE